MSFVTSLFGGGKAPSLPPVPEPPKVPTKKETGSNTSMRRRAGAFGRQESILAPTSNTKKDILGG